MQANKTNNSHWSTLYSSTKKSVLSFSVRNVTIRTIIKLKVGYLLDYWPEGSLYCLYKEILLIACVCFPFFCVFALRSRLKLFSFPNCAKLVNE